MPHAHPVGGACKRRKKSTHKRRKKGAHAKRTSYAAAAFYGRDLASVDDASFRNHN
jgi:hypothetical protein